MKKFEVETKIEFITTHIVQAESEQEARKKAEEIALDYHHIQKSDLLDMDSDVYETN